MDEILKNIETETVPDKNVIEPIFRQALGHAYAILPQSVRTLHDCTDRRHWQGIADVSTGTGFFAQSVRRIFGFPQDNIGTSVTVEISRAGDRELWVRDFGGKRFRSEIRLWGEAGSHRITERFGAFRFLIHLSASETKLAYPVERGWVLGIPIPSWLLPTSISTESDVQGEFRFDVAIELPGIGRIVHYVGQLREF